MSKIITLICCFKNIFCTVFVLDPLGDKIVEMVLS